MKHATLIVIDMQNDFVTGALGSKEAVEAVPNVKQILTAASEENTTTLFTKDTHTEDYLQTQEGKYLPVPHCIKNTEGWDIIPELKPFAKPEQTIWKPTFGSLQLSSLIPPNTDAVFLTGVCTDICVISNALLLKASFPELPIYLITDACAGVTPETHQAALTVAKSCQIQLIDTTTAVSMLKGE